VTNWTRIREEFPALSNWTYLNTATYGQTPRAGARAISAHFARRDDFACYDFLEWFDDADRLREEIAQLVNCTGEDVAFASSASQALAVLLNGLDWSAGDEIASLEGEFPNNVYAPAMVKGAVSVQTSWPRFYDAITNRTRLVLMSTANYANGFRPPIEEISRFLRERGVLLYVDGTQSVGALRFDIQRARPSVLAVHGYKWLLAPTGAAFFYVDPELRGRLRPNVVGWRSDRGWRNVNELNHGAPELTEAAERYEGGMIPFVLLYAMQASVRMMLDIGPERIENRVLELASRVETVLRDAGASIENPGSHIVAARLPATVDAGEAAARLKSERVLVSARHGSLRVSAHFYNNETDIDRFAAALNGCVRGLARAK
jgi:selenocysteine lyase/cysteine desulfurase